ncbi:Uncharacterised protein [Vibrio cholerae]|nr:Uncharacterised protein [Vibrio cholerae]CSB86359.1 Uncharacterised protein [Vibrio cholerae]CSC93512.1 Uncharacterised protein [Vibrio cholerae]
MHTLFSGEGTELGIEIRQYIHNRKTVRMQIDFAGLQTRNIQQIADQILRRAQSTFNMVGKFLHLRLFSHFR